MPVHRTIKARAHWGHMGWRKFTIKVLATRVLPAAPAASTATTSNPGELGILVGEVRAGGPARAGGAVIRVPGSLLDFTSAGGIAKSPPHEAKSLGMLLGDPSIGGPPGRIARRIV